MNKLAKYITVTAIDNLATKSNRVVTLVTYGVTHRVFNSLSW